jgi:hypothetical protein
MDGGEWKEPTYWHKALVEILCLIIDSYNQFYIWPGILFQGKWLLLSNQPTEFVSVLRFLEEGWLHNANYISIDFSKKKKPHTKKV